MTRNDLVVFSLEPWDDVWRRNQYLIDGLLRRDASLRVLFIEPARDVLHDALHGRFAARGAGLRTVDAYDDRLMLFQPTKVLPRAVGAAADALWLRSVRRAIRRAAMVDPVLWINDANGAALLRATRAPSLYDITDDWLVADRAPRELARLRADEATLMELCREVVVCSPALQASRGRTRSVRLIPNAVDLARYRTPVPRPDDLPAGEVAVYVGTLHEDRLDVELAMRTAERLRGRAASVVFVGPVALSTENRARLEASGAVLLGGRGFERVPAYLQHASVLIVPHAVNAFTDSLDPIKLYEYLAVGRPVVSTPVAGFRDAVDPALHVAPAEEFPAVVEGLVARRIPSSSSGAVADWDERVDAMAVVLADVRRPAV